MCSTATLIQAQLSYHAYYTYDTVKAINASWGMGARNVESSSQQHPFKLNRVHPIKSSTSVF